MRLSPIPGMEGGSFIACLRELIAARGPKQPGLHQCGEGLGQADTAGLCAALVPLAASSDQGSQVYCVRLRGVVLSFE